MVPWFIISSFECEELHMFTLMEKTRAGDAIFIDWQRNNFYFLIKIIKNEQDISFSLSYGYKNTEWTFGETIENILSPNVHEEAKTFCREANSYANKDNPVFIAELKEAGLYSDPLHEDDNTSAFRP